MVKVRSSLRFQSFSIEKKTEQYKERRTIPHSSAILVDAAVHRNDNHSVDKRIPREAALRYLQHERLKFANQQSDLNKDKQHGERKIDLTID